VDIETLKMQFPGVFEAARNEGFQAGLTEGAAKERSRIETIYKIPMKNLSEADMAIKVKAMFTSEKTASDVALDILQAQDQRATEFAANHIAGAKALAEQIKGIGSANVDPKKAQNDFVTQNIAQGMR
jgi:hypothetical protein